MSNFFGSSSTNNEATQAELGSRLYNIKQSSIGTESVLSILPDNNVVVNSCSSFGKSLLNVSSLNGLVGLLNSADTKVEVIDSGTGEINFTLDNALKMVVKNAYTEVLNELRALNINPLTDLEYSLGASNKRWNNIYGNKIVSGNIYSSSTTTPMIFGQDTTERMRVNGSGQLEVKTATINNGAIKISTPTQNQNQYTFLGFSGDGSDGNDRARVGCKFGSAGAGNLFFTTGGSGTQKERILITEGGQVQVGSSTDPNSGIILYNNSSVSDARAISNSVLSNEICGLASSGSDQGQLRLSAGGNTTLSSKTYIDLFGNANHVMIFGTKGAEKMRIAGNDFVGVGVVAPDERLHIGGNLKVNGNILPEAKDSRDIGSPSLPFNGVYCNGLIQPSASNAMSFNTNSSNRMFLNSSGRLILSTAVAGGAGSSNGGIALFNGSGNNEQRATSASILSNEIRGLSSNGSDAGVLRVGAGGNTDSANHSYMDFEGYGTRAIKFVNSNTIRMIINSSGNVGIGTSNPQNQLNIEKQYGGALNEAGSLTLSTISGSIPWGCGAISAYVNAGLNNNNSSFPGGLLFKTKSAGGSDFTLTTRMVLDALGNLGINNTAPQEKLDVGGNAKITGNVLFDADNTRNVGSSGQALNSVFAHNGVFKAITVHSATAGNIGTSAKPFNTLFVSNIGSSGTPVSTLYADVWATSSSTGLRCANNLVLATDLALPTITWYDVNAKSMIIVDTVNTTDGSKLTYDSANSELLIGTTSTSVERLRVGANGLKTSVNILPTDSNRTIGSSSSKFNALYTNTILNPDANLVLGRGTTSTVVVSTTGMSVGTGGNPTEALEIYGNIKVSGNIVPNTNNVPSIGTSNTNRFLAGYFGTVYGGGVALTSDRRLKEEIKPITNGLETVLKMKPVEYKMKGRVRLHTGFLADEMKNLYNNEDWACFVEDQDEFKTQSLQYTEVVAVLAKAIQDLNGKVMKIENRKLVGGSVIDTSGLTEDFVQIYQRLEAIESQPTRPTLHKCIEVSRFNQMYDKIANLEVRLSAFDEEKDSEESELIHSLMEKNNQLELKVNELETKLNTLPKTEAKCNDFLESDGGLNMNELLQQKNFELEQRLIKLEKQNKRLVQAVNKLLKSNDV